MWYVVLLLCSTQVYGWVYLIDRSVTPICVLIHYVTQYYINCVLVWSGNVCPHTVHCVHSILLSLLYPSTLCKVKLHCVGSWHVLVGHVVQCYHQCHPGHLGPTGLRQGFLALNKLPWSIFPDLPFLSRGFTNTHYLSKIIQIYSICKKNTNTHYLSKNRITHYLSKTTNLHYLSKNTITIWQWSILRDCIEWSLAL